MPKRLLIGLSIFFTFIYPFLLMPYGLDFKDNFYHLTAYTGQRIEGGQNGYFLTFLYPLPGKIWLSFAPNTVLSFRIMGTILRILIQVLPVVIILNALRASRIVKWSLVSAALIIAYGVPRGIGYDLIAGLWGAMIFAITTLYILHGGKYKLIFIGFLIAGFVGTRFPNIAVLAPLTLIILGKGWYESRKIQEIFGAIGLMAISSVIFYFLFYFLFGENTFQDSIRQSISVYFDQFTNFFSKPPGSHDTSILLKNYWRDGKQILKNLLILASFVGIWKVIPINFRLSGLVRAILVFSLWYYIMHELTGTSYGWSYVLFANACTALALGILLFLAFKKNEKQWILIGVLSLSFGFISSLGSNTGFLKMLWSYSYILPIAVWFIWKRVNGPDRILTGVLTGTLILFGIAEYTYFGSRLEDDRWYQLQSEVNHPMLRGIYTSNTRKEMLEEILEHISDIKAKHPEAKMVYHGRFAWIFRYLDNSKDFYNNNVRMLYSDPEETGLLEAYLDQHPSNSYVVLVYGYPEWMPDADNGLVGDLMQQKSYGIYAEGKSYRIYTAAMENK